MSLDDSLANMLNAMETNNFWDTEAYGNEILNYIDDSSNVVNDSIDRSDLKNSILGIINSAKKMRLMKSSKSNLIDEITNHSCKRVKIPKEKHNA